MHGTLDQAMPCAPAHTSRCNTSICPTPTQLLEHPNIAEVFPADVIARAKLLVQAIPGGLGAYRCGGAGTAW